eukprot:CAMPEP_0178440368 /NCGR_PEP_ID=MMETSP0689_2-20121128/36744_1 /TAXON_ID=160604 /ORGANISM="Amphidinium massartii, Strain CS-259" /LENGTH=198 /DNA_ID=CAMNT_0020063143 /DNA_START=33 /DNA_END=626 /DNA_ORIENTATION=+
MSLSSGQRLSPHNCFFMLCDLQERLVDSINQVQEVIMGAKALLQASSILKIPTIVTEQDPQGLRHTVRNVDIRHATVFSRVSMSALTPELADFVQPFRGSSCVLFGLETHIAIQQTTLDLLEYGMEVHVVSDCTASMRSFDREVALKRLEQSGAVLTTVDSLLFELMRTERSHHFMHLSAVARTYADGMHADHRLWGL